MKAPLFSIYLDIDDGTPLISSRDIAKVLGEPHLQVLSLILDLLQALYKDQHAIYGVDNFLLRQTDEGDEPDCLLTKDGLALLCSTRPHSIALWMEGSKAINDYEKSVKASPKGKHLMASSAVCATNLF